MASSLWENWIEEMRGPQRLLIILEILLSLLSVVAQRVKNLSAMQETRVRSLGLEDTLEEGMATHSSILAWRIPMARGAWWATVHRVAESDTAEQLSTAQGHVTRKSRDNILEDTY